MAPLSRSAPKILFLPPDRYVPGVLGEVRKMLGDLKTKERYQRRREVYEKRMFELLDKEDLEAEKISCGLICAYTALTEKMVTIYDLIAYKVPPLVLEMLIWLNPKFYNYLETFYDENTAFFRMISPEAFNRFVRDFHSDWGTVADMEAALEAKQKKELDKRASEAAICTIL